MQNKIVRAIDVGYGNTKFTTSDGTDGDIDCMMFPSLAPMASNSGVDRSMDKKDTIVVNGGGEANFEIGPDSLSSMSSYGTRTLDLDFVRRESYLAFMRGAMFYMKTDHIDVLIVGLPVSNMDAMAGLVKSQLVGVHPLPGGSVRVKEVLVVPQPVGGMYDFGVRNRLMEKIETSTSLLIDPGYFTLDWVIANGTKMVGARSGAASNAGVSAILRYVLDKISAKVVFREHRTIEISENVLSRLDKAILGKSDFRIFGKVEDISTILCSPNPIISDALSKLRTKVGSLDDIDRVVIVGGGAHHYEKALLDMFPGFDIRIAKNQIFSNVRGFQMMGNIMAKNSPTV